MATTWQYLGNDMAMWWHCTILVHFAAPALLFFFDRRGTTALGGLGFGSSVSTASFMSPAPISLAADIHKQGLNGCQQASATSERTRKMTRTRRWKSKREKEQKEEEEDNDEDEEKE